MPVARAGAPPRTRVYVRMGVIAMVPDDARSAAEPIPVPGALEALGHLADGTHELFVIDASGQRPPMLNALPLDVRVVSTLADMPAGSWLITDEPETCSSVPRGVRTILVGPRRAATHRPTARCDAEARDLSAAVIDILAREAMS